jgi:hypothetical protein
MTTTPGDPFETALAHLERMGVEVLADERLAIADTATAGHAPALTRLADRIATTYSPAPAPRRTRPCEPASLADQVDAWHRGEELPDYINVGEFRGDRGPESAHWYCTRCEQLSRRHPNRRSATASAWLHVDLNICPKPHPEVQP